MTSRVRLGELFARGRVGTLLAHRLARASGVTGGVTKALCVLTTVRFAMRRVGTLLAWGGEVPCTLSSCLAQATFAVSGGVAGGVTKT